LVFALEPTTLRPIVLVLLVAVALFFLLRRRRPPRSAVIGEPQAPAAAPPGWAITRRNPVLFAALIGGTMGLYDGFFGPGAGTFLIALQTGLFGDDLTEASANAKVANFASNLGSVILFAIEGKIELRWAIPMAVMQALGAFAGTRAAIR